VTGGAGTDTLIEVENLVGSAYADKLTGTTFGNVLAGGAGNDSLYGGLGSDTMSGGDGADIYSVQDAGDVVIETNISPSSAESDMVYSYVANYTLGANVEDGRVMLAGFANMSGNALDNVLYAATGNNVLNGAGGIDTLSYAFGAASGATASLALAGAQVTGGSGSDTLAGIENLSGTAYADHFTGDAGANALTGAGGNDTLAGGGGDDRLEGGAGDDSMSGGDGVDTVSYATGGVNGVVINLTLAGAQANGGFGADTLSGIENVVGTVFADKLTGTAGANELKTHWGNDSLYGGFGSDTMNGGDGADIYSVQDAGDVIIETNSSASAAESDLVYSYIGHYTLAANVEQGRIMNVTANLTGNARDNLLFASAGANVLDGAAGIDTVSYAFGASSGVTVSLGPGVQPTGGSGFDTLTSIENLIGTKFADKLYGNAGVNVLTGALGNDSLAGGAGSDTMSGGAGADIFKYFGVSDSISAAADTITDFTSGLDQINLSLVDANEATDADDAFTTLIGSAEAFTAAGQLRLTDGVLYGNTDADAEPEFAIVLTGVVALLLGDFAL
jgi:Ca2+-binding RTX toxin-like protein